MEFGAIIIGDEILTGKREDRHMSRLIGLLAVRGLELAFCEYIGDVPQRITHTLRRTYGYGDTAVFCFGGIGATPDDHTRQCAAAAAGVPLARHPGAVAEMEAQFGVMPADHPRYLMADIPAGCELIPNPFNRVPGFSVGEHHFLPGFPEMAGPMMEWVLDHRYADLHHARMVLVLVDLTQCAGDVVRVDPDGAAEPVAELVVLEPARHHHLVVGGV